MQVEALVLGPEDIVALAESLHNPQNWEILVRWLDKNAKPELSEKESLLRDLDRDLGLERAIHTILTSHSSYLKSPEEWFIENYGVVPPYASVARAKKVRKTRRQGNGRKRVRN